MDLTQYRVVGDKRLRVDPVDLYTAVQEAQAIMAGSNTVTMQQNRVVEDAGAGYHQLTKYVDRFGSRLTKYERHRKTIAAHLQTYVDRFQKASLMSANNGAYALSYYSNAAGSQYAMPVYIFDLTGVPNVVRNPSAPGAVFSATSMPFRRLYRNNDGAGLYGFTTLQINGRNADDTGDESTWILEERGSSGQSVGNTAMLNWFDIKMLITGATSRPSRVRVDIARFTEDAIAPTAACNSSGAVWNQHNEPSEAVGVIPDTDFAKWNDLWLQWCSPLIGNPIARRGTTRKSCIDVMYSKTFAFEPTLSIEDDRRGHQKEFHLRYNMDKVHFYTEGGILDPMGTGAAGGAAEVTAPEQINPNEWSVNDRTLTSIYPSNKGRTFLIISGMTCLQNTQDTDMVAANHASFDLIVRRKRQQLHF